MKPIKITLALFTLALTALWAASALPGLDTTDSHALGVAFTQFTGSMSIAMMAFANLLAVRPKLLEPVLDGLDKMYRLHKWLGIGGLGFGVVHWLTATGDGRRPPMDATATAEPVATASDAATQTIFSTLQGPAHGIAQPALWILIALIAVALIKRFSYTIFAKSHILMVPIFWALAFHSIVLTKASYWATPIAWVNAALIAIGTLASILSLAHFFGLGIWPRAKVLSATHYPEVHVVEAELLVNKRWPGHKPGQFAFVTTDWKEGAHPFTIATAWNPKTRKIGFLTKELGDYSANMRQHFTLGRKVLLEGPYGEFTFESLKPRQIWVGAGIGIAPFVARMRHLATIPGEKPIDLFHSTSGVTEAGLANMRRDAAAAGIRLHIYVSAQDGRLDAQKIMAQVPDWKNASFWFCGPTAFGTALRRDLGAAGMAEHDFHSELFEMR